MKDGNRGEVSEGLRDVPEKLSGPAYLHEDGRLSVCKGGVLVHYRVRVLKPADEETIR